MLMESLVAVRLEAAVARRVASGMVQMLEGPPCHQVQLGRHAREVAGAAQAAVDERQRHHSGPGFVPSGAPQALELDLRTVEHVELANARPQGFPAARCQSTVSCGRRALTRSRPRSRTGGPVVHRCPATFWFVAECGFAISLVPRGLASDQILSLIHISEPTRLGMISYAVFCL